MTNWVDDEKTLELIEHARQTGVPTYADKKDGDKMLVATGWAVALDYLEGLYKGEVQRLEAEYSEHLEKMHEGEDLPY